jgi:hypothetical protein
MLEDDDAASHHRRPRAVPMTTERLIWASARPYEGPRWRVAVLRADGSRAHRAADAAIDQLREAGCMAIDHDPARIDPFLDVETQWAAAVATVIRPPSSARP